MIKREKYLEKITNLIDKDIIKVLTGVRRCGKSTMIHLIIDYLREQGVSEDNIIYINLDSINFLNITTIHQLNEYIQLQIPKFNNKSLAISNSENSIDELTISKTQNKSKIYLFLDEIQKIDQWEKLVNAYFSSKDFDIYITGSNANLLSGELATHLTGRYMEIKIYPFSFIEYLDYFKESSLSKRELFNQYIKFGGMPVSYKFKEDSEKTQFLSDLFDSIIYNDIVKRFSIKDIDLFTRLINFIFSNIGQLVSANSIVKYLKKNQINMSVNTVYNYLSYIEEACLIFKVKREDLIGKKILNHLEKYYIVDTGFREAIFNKNIDDIGQILENIVYIELLRRGYKVNIGKFTNKEIDFICTKGKNRIYIQVTYILAEKSTIEREFNPLLAINDNYPKYVLSLDEFDRSYKGIKNLNIVDFLLGNEI